MLNKPQSKLIDRMDYYIANDQGQSEDYIKINSPEEIKICDPACGSGHMLVYAFDLLYAIYQEEGYEENEIPAKILTHNLYGIEIDERAGELAAFALTMKARAKYKRFFSKPVQPNICVLENIDFSEDDLAGYINMVGRDLFTEPLLECLRQFKEAKNFGSLIRPAVQDVNYVVDVIKKKNLDMHTVYSPINQKVLQALEQADYLSQKYHVVVANPPYMGGKGMNGSLSNFAKQNYPDSKSDLFAMFIDRTKDLTLSKAYAGMITMQSWMFLSSFEKLRKNITASQTVISMAHLGPRAFDSIGGEVVQATSFVLHRQAAPEFKGSFIRLIDGKSEAEKNKQLLEAIHNPNCSYFYHASAEDFKKIPGSPIAYWVSENIRKLFSNYKTIGEIAAPRKGNTTTNNDLFLRAWFEVDTRNIGFSAKDASLFNHKKWAPYNKGGGFRKWYGFNEFLVNWLNNGHVIKAIPHSVIANEKFFFKPGLTWSTVTSGIFSLRQFGDGYIFDNGGCCVFGDTKQLELLLVFMNSKVFREIFSKINPTLNYQSGDIAKVPVKPPSTALQPLNFVAITKQDWDSYETSWDFQSLPLISSKEQNKSLKETYTKLRTEWQSITDEMKKLEEENNKIFIEAYGLEDELTPSSA